TSGFDAGMKAISAPGFRDGALPVILLTASVMYFKGMRKECFLLAAAMLLAALVSFAVKDLVARPRPSGELVEIIQAAGGYSFPSSHVMHYVVFLGTLGTLLTPRIRPGTARWLVYTSLALFMIAIGISRIYLGVHWLGDVFGGYILGGGIVALAAWLWRMWLSRENDTSARHETVSYSSIIHASDD
ncbi:MAG: phosphatase PAP2 family protein, partial [Ardenticatenaceae bacterium]